MLEEEEEEPFKGRTRWEGVVKKTGDQDLREPDKT